MGFRSTCVTQHYYLPFPRWFVDKYSHFLHFNGDTEKELPISSRFEFKTYFAIGEDLPKDIQKVMNESTGRVSDSIVLLWLHECGGITRVEIRKDKITYSEPTGWKITDGVTHDYCYGCSDIENIRP